MVNSYLQICALAAVLLGTAGCSKSWRVDYAEPAAQFDEETLLEKGAAFVGEKVTVKGVVTRQDLSDPDNCRIYLGYSICCNLGDMRAQAAAYSPGSTVFIDGFLERCEEGDISLDPAVGRDPGAPFTPME